MRKCSLEFGCQAAVDPDARLPETLSARTTIRPGEGGTVKKGRSVESYDAGMHRSMSGLRFPGVQGPSVCRRPLAVRG